MLAYRTTTTISEVGVLQLEKLPFPVGSIVEIIVLANEATDSSQEHRLLRDSIVKYESPTEPVDQDDWTVMTVQESHSKSNRS